jgi:hypothetical protein
MSGSALTTMMPMMIALRLPFTHGMLPKKYPASVSEPTQAMPPTTLYIVYCFGVICAMPATNGT